MEDDFKKDGESLQSRSDYGHDESRPAGGYSAEGRKLRPRKSSGEHRNYGEHRSERVGGFNYSEKRGYGDRQFSSEDGERRSYGDRRPGGEHRSYGQGGERRPYGQRSGSYGQGERRQDGERSGYGDRRPGGERRGYGQGGERRSYGQGGYGQRSGYGQGERRQDGERSSYGERRSGGYGDKRPGGEQRSYSPRVSSYGQSSYEHRGGFSQGEGDKPRFERPQGPRPQGPRPQNARPQGPRPQGPRPQGPKPQKIKKKREYIFTETDEAGISRMISRRPAPNPSDYSDFDAVPTNFSEEVRLNKFIANSGVCSRREADTFIQAGVVTVNGVVVTELGTKVNAVNDDVRFNGERLKGEEKVYIVMNKPKGYVTTASDPHAEKTVMDLLKGCSSRVFPVGRLDKNTTGVLMFTNDGEIAEKLTHPSYDKKKIYQVILDHELKQEDYDQILQGVTLVDGVVAADELEYIDESDHRRLGIEIHSGKNRIVRRIFESLGYDVRALDRVYFAGLTKKGVSKGEWRYLTEGEVNILKMGAYV